MATTSLDSLTHEIAFVSAIPYCYEKLNFLEAELRAYKDLCFSRSQMDPAPSLWEFWLSAELVLPAFWDCAQEVALITPSSCTVERVFSLLTQGFDSSQESALEDYVVASVMIRFNHIWRTRDLR